MKFWDGIEDYSPKNRLGKVSHLTLVLRWFFGALDGSLAPSMVLWRPRWFFGPRNAPPQVNPTCKVLGFRPVRKSVGNRQNRLKIKTFIVHGLYFHLRLSEIAKNRHTFEKKSENRPDLIDGWDYKAPSFSCYVTHPNQPKSTINLTAIGDLRQKSKTC